MRCSWSTAFLALYAASAAASKPKLQKILGKLTKTGSWVGPVDPTVAARALYGRAPLKPYNREEVYAERGLGPLGGTLNPNRRAEEIAGVPWIANLIVSADLDQKLSQEYPSTIPDPKENDAGVSVSWEWAKNEIEAHGIKVNSKYSPVSRYPQYKLTGTVSTGPVKQWMKAVPYAGEGQPLFNLLTPLLNTQIKRQVPWGSHATALANIKMRAISLNSDNAAYGQELMREKAIAEGMAKQKAAADDAAQEKKETRRQAMNAVAAGMGMGGMPCPI